MGAPSSDAADRGVTRFVGANAAPGASAGMLAGVISTVAECILQGYYTHCAMQRRVVVTSGECASERGEALRIFPKKRL